MLRFHNISSFPVLILFAIFVRASFASEPSAKPDLAQLRNIISKTQEKLAKKMATWMMVYELPSGIEVHVNVYSAPNLMRYEMFGSARGEKGKWIDIISRDGAWFVFNGKEAGKYRPYEAPTEIPVVYLFLQRANPSFVDMDYLASKASYEAIENKVALYRVSFSDDIKKQLENTLSQMTLLLKNATRENIDPELIRESEKTKEMIEDMLQRGTPLKINLETGLVVQSGIVGKRAWVRDFQWHENVDESIFRVDDRRWVDHTDPISGLGSTDIMMFKHSGVWRPGQQTGELETKLLNYKTGDIRRVPYRGAQCVPLCFSQDRKRVYVGGLNLETALIGLFEINLEHLTQKQLGLPLLNRGYVLGGALSLDEKHLAVIQCGINNKYPSFSNQVVLVDLASGEAKPLGKPLDGAFLSWIPDGSGLVLVSRESKRLDQPPEGTVCRMDIQGNITALLKGNMPCALSPKPFILYEGDNRKWMTCDVDGKEIKPFMNGLNGFSFPSPSPDGKQLIMMQFGSADGPVPHLIDISSGKITPIRVPPGLWATPVWK